MHPYHQKLARHESRRWLVRLFPPGLLDFVRLFRYRRRYPGTVVTGASRVACGARFGSDVIVRNSTIDKTVEIGRFTTVADGGRFSGLGSIRIGQFCSIGPDCVIRSDNHKFDRRSTYPFGQVVSGGAGTIDDYEPADVSIGSDVWIGERVLILPGATIGHGCIIAAGAVVPRGDFPPFSVIGGVPARVIRTRFTPSERESILAGHWWDRPENEIFNELHDYLTKDIVDKPNS